jgi:hypothetical protein
MSLLRWFARKSDAEAAPSSSLRESRPAAAESRKNERNARRERLYDVVRHSMANAGVLSSAYRFKVLSLDGRGRQFLVMVDLVGAPGGDTADLGRIEAAMQQSARVQHGIAVKAVYWREALETGQRAAVPSVPATQVRPAAAAVAAAPAASFGADADPLLAEEIAAFRQALTEGGERPAARALDGASVPAPQSYTLLTGFEDTEIREPLSTSQHGDLR